MIIKLDHQEKEFALKKKLAKCIFTIS